MWVTASALPVTGQCKNTPALLIIVRRSHRNTGHPPASRRSTNPIRTVRIIIQETADRPGTAES
ncbi:hypothetical protein FRAAL3329 [Frankia alni ACN14a]|uniref:Uncharacterized protein n=1 Tax=Frankia alni (strain DSM 45986 / CECT 9034 / ACN14a) TaxID=326424 RepID=Q0RKI5_FRAAA|nr:hypothetical protein FRAAL3329 [Frankia alni ACN14a]